MVTVRVLAAVLTMGGLCYVIGFRHGSDLSRHQRVRALVEDLTCWDDPR